MTPKTLFLLPQSHLISSSPQGAITTPTKKKLYIYKENSYNDKKKRANNYHDNETPPRGSQSQRANGGEGGGA